MLSSFICIRFYPSRHLKFVKNWLFQGKIGLNIGLFCNLWKQMIWFQGKGIVLRYNYTHLLTCKTTAAHAYFLSN